MIVNPSDLLALLNQSKALKANDAAYQMLKRLLGLIGQNNVTVDQSITGIITTLNNVTFFTENDERGTFPSSLQLLPGLNLSFDTSVAGQVTINATAATPPVWIRDNEVDEPFIIPGPKGLTGDTGPVGPAGSSGSGGGAIFLRENEQDEPVVPALILNPSGVTPGTYGDTSHVSQITLGADGRVISAANVVIAAASGATYTTGSGNPQGVVTANVGTIYVDSATGYIYQKLAGSGNTGWYPNYYFGGSLFGAFGPQIMMLNGTLTSTASIIETFGIRGGVSTGGVSLNAGTLDFGIDTIGHYNSLSTTTTNAGLVGPFGASTSAMGWTNDFDMVWRIKTDASSVLAIRYWFGFSTADPSTDTISGRCIVMRFSTTASDGGWVGVTNDNTGQSVTATVAAIAANTAYTLRIRRVSNTVYFSVNDGAEVATTTKVPTDTTQGYFICYVSATAGTKAFRIYRFGGIYGAA